MRELKYLGVGTVEFLFEDGHFYFIEMNTRIQVEHPVTEMITDIDLVLEQIRVAAGGDLPVTQKDVRFHGHAIECRINAENPSTFLPSPGKILSYHPPGGLGVRVDSAVYQGYTIPPFYDSLVGKLIVHGKTRTECLMRLRRALDEFVVDGIETTLPLFRTLVREQDIIDGNYHIHWLEQFLAERGMALVTSQLLVRRLGCSSVHTLSGSYGFGTKIEPDTASSCSIAVDQSGGIDHRQFGPQLPGQLRQAGAVHAARQIDVGEQHVARRAASQVFQRLLGAGRDMNLAAVLGQDLRDHRR